MLTLLVVLCGTNAAVGHMLAKSSNREQVAAEAALVLVMVAKEERRMTDNANRHMTCRVFELLKKRKGGKTNENNREGERRK